MDCGGFVYRDVINVTSDPRPMGGMASILSQVAYERSVTIEALKSLSRVRRIAHARQEFMWKCRQIKWPDGTHRYSLPMIAQFLGLKDHTTIGYGVAVHDLRRQGLDTRGLKSWRYEKRPGANSTGLKSTNQTEI